MLDCTAEQIHISRHDVGPAIIHRSRFSATLLLGVCMTVTLLIPAIALGATYAGTTSYDSFNLSTSPSVNYTMNVWLGDHVAILTPDDATGLHAPTLLKMTDTYDDAYEYYWSATGKEPIRWSSGRYAFEGRGTMAVVESTCGAGCGYLGYTGIEIMSAYFKPTHDGVRYDNKYDQILFYELGRNFWHYHKQMGGVSGGQLGRALSTGYAVFMRFMSMDAAGIDGADFGDWSFEEFRYRVENQVDLYEQDPSLNFSNTLAVNKGVPGSGSTGPDLFASMVFRLGRDYGEEAFFQNIWKQVGYRPGVTYSNQRTDQQAVDNFFLASSYAAGQDLSSVFDRWTWPISGDARGIAATIEQSYPDSPTLIAVDSFDYESGVLGGKGGYADGWNVAWTGGQRVVAPGMRHGNLTAAGNAAESGSGDAAFRDLNLNPTARLGLADQIEDGKLGKDGTSVWISFLADGSGANLGETWSGISLFDESSERLLLGKPDQASNWGVGLPCGGDPETVLSDVPISDQVLFLTKIDFLSGDEALHVWINPSLDGVPEDAEAAISTMCGDFDFDRVRIAGNTLITYDELRLGLLYTDVIQPVPEPSALLLVSLALAWYGLGTRWVRMDWLRH
jgi:hypothetical protein